MKKVCLLLTALTMVFTLASCGDTAKSSSVQQSSGTQQSASSQLSGKVSTGGSTSVEKVIGALSEAYMAQNSKVTVTYDPTGSGAGITGAMDGSLDIGLSSRNLKDGESGITATPFALDGIAIVVNKANAINDISIDTLAKIAKGEITNWKELGGKDEQIVFIGREAGSGTRDGFETIVKVKDECKYSEELTATGAIIGKVQANTAAIGYASLASVDDKIKALTVEGTAASEATVQDGTYKLQRPFLILTKENTEQSAAVKSFIDFATNEANAEIIANAGAVPMAK